MENGKSSPSEYTMRQLATALHIPLTELIDDHEVEEIADPANRLKQDVLHRVHLLSEPALVRLSDFLKGLEASESITSSESSEKKELPE